MAISPVLQHVDAVQSAAGEAARVFSRPITAIVVTGHTIRVVAHDESVEFEIRHPGAHYDSRGEPMIGGSMPTIVGGTEVRIAGRRKRRRVPGAGMSPERLIMLRGAIEYTAHDTYASDSAIHVRGRFFRVTCGRRTRWILCTHARCVPYPLTALTRRQSSYLC